MDVHEHRWLPFGHGVDSHGVPRVATVYSDWRRCTCGVFEHEEFTHSERNCRDPGCERERGHPGPHRARYYAGHGNIDEQEWEDEDPTTYAGAVGYG